MLLINGMPVIHIELKRTGIPVSQAAGIKLENTAQEGMFRGLFSLVQIFVAMTPDETKYFANPSQMLKVTPIINSIGQTFITNPKTTGKTLPLIYYPFPWRTSG